MMSELGSTCQFGNSVQHTGRLTNFEENYLRAQILFADSEVGDQIDERDQTIIDAAYGTEVQNVDIGTLGLSSREMQECLARRYMGECTVRSCAFFTIIGDAIDKATKSDSVEMSR